LIPAPAETTVSRKALRVAERRVSIKEQKHSLRTLITMMSAMGLMATFALPSYGFDPETTALSGLAHDNTMVDISAPSQGLSVAAVRAVEFSRGDYQEADASQFEVKAVSRVAYTGPRAEDYVANPRFTSVTSASIMKAAAELVGTPYVYGGSTPSGFDCSGYVLFVYSQFGLDLPHSVYQQSRIAVKVPLADAVPGDIVTFNDYSHNGIYAGNGNFYHSPQPGDRVKLAPIFTDRFYITRFVEISN
jgi:cell wall-associated NlpC family hydrolase